MANILESLRWLKTVSRTFQEVDMSSLKDARDMTLISHSQGLITGEELLLLLEENTSRNPEFTYDAYDRFDLENMEEAECKSEFRVEKRDIPLLAEALGLPDTFAQK